METAIASRIELGRRIVEEQVEYFSRQFGQVSSDWKSDGTRVTEADIHLSLVFADELGEGFPEDQFLSEELDHGTTPIAVASEFAWLLDPIDGTNNFARGVPTCSISLGLLHKGMPVYGFIYDYASRSLIHGGPGHGIRIGVAEYTRPELALTPQSIISMQSLPSDSAMRDEDALQRSFKLRAMGSSAIHMAYAAVGWTDGVIAHNVKSWDIAAGVALMTAVGGCTRFFDAPIFPITQFDSKGKGFAHIAGMPETCDAIENAIGHQSRFSI